jgi:hypothetical protein
MKSPFLCSPLNPPEGEYFAQMLALPLPQQWLTPTPAVKIRHYSKTRLGGNLPTISMVTTAIYY